MCPGPSRPERFRPQGFPPSRRFPRTLVLRSPHPSPLGAGLHAAAVQDLFYRVSFRVLRLRRNRPPLPGWLAPSSFGLAPRSSATRRALISLDFPRRPRPSGPPSPEAPSVTSCVLERSRPRRSGRSPSGARATFPPGSTLSLGPDFLVTRRHGEPCSPSRRSVDLGAFFLPRARSLPRRRHRLVDRDPPGVPPLQSLDPDSASGPD